MTSSRCSTSGSHLATSHQTRNNAQGLSRTREIPSILGRKLRRTGLVRRGWNTCQAVTTTAVYLESSPLPLREGSTGYRLDGKLSTPPLSRPARHTMITYAPCLSVTRPLRRVTSALGAPTRQPEPARSECLLSETSSCHELRGAWSYLHIKTFSQLKGVMR